MAIVYCSNCVKPTDVPDVYAGRTVKCPHCRELMHVGEAATKPASEPSSAITAARPAPRPASPPPASGSRHPDASDSALKTCGNCVRTIGKLEKAFVWEGTVVCAGCYSTLHAQQDDLDQDRSSGALHPKANRQVARRSVGPAPSNDFTPPPEHTQSPPQGVHAASPPQPRPNSPLLTAAAVLSFVWAGLMVLIAMFQIGNDIVALGIWNLLVCGLYDSVAANGILYPLAITEHGGVLDGRYRLRSAKELGMKELPVIVVAPADAVSFVFESKNAREHLTEGERAVLAVQYHSFKSPMYIAQRTEQMNAARKAKAATGETAAAQKPIVTADAGPGTALGTDKGYGPAPRKLDSRKEACETYRVPERMFRKVQRLSHYRPDLYQGVLAGELSPEAALKQQGKNMVKNRVAAAKEKHVRPEDVMDTSLENAIHQGDAHDVLKTLPDGIASLTLFSPPYYGVAIDYDPPLPEESYEQYLTGLRGVLSESHRVSRTGGRLAIVLDTIANPLRGTRHTMLPVVADVTRLAIDCGWDYWADIAWLKNEISGKKTNFGSLSLCSAPHFGRNHEWILLFYRDVKKLEGDHTLCDLGREEHLEWWTSTWSVRPETRSTIRDHHPAPFPEAVAERLIKLLTYRRDLVIDPFNGSGTTTAVAKRLGRRYIGLDRSPTYCAYARTRCMQQDAAERSPETAQENR